MTRRTNNEPRRSWTDVNLLTFSSLYSFLRARGTFFWLSQQQESGKTKEQQVEVKVTFSDEGLIEIEIIIYNVHG